MITIKDYADKKGVSSQAIYKQLKIHKIKLEGHIFKEKGKTVLDEDACAFLDSRTKENPVVIIDQLNKQELERLKKRETDLLEEIRVKDNIIIKAQQDQKLLENKNKEIENDLNEQLKSKEEEIEKLKKELEQEKNKKWWEKIFK